MNLQPPVLETGALPIELRPWVGVDCIGASADTLQPVAAPSQRNALGMLFAVLAAVLAAVAAAALVGAGDRPVGWVVALAALAIAGWLASISLASFRRR